MSYKEKQTPKGVLKYRMPNIVEGYDFLSMLEASSGTSGFFKAKAKFIANMAPLIDYSACGYGSYDELLNDKSSMFHAMSEIAQEVFDDITEALAKKH